MARFRSSPEARLLSSLDDRVVNAFLIFTSSVINHFHSSYALFCDECVVRDPTNFVYDFIKKKYLSTTSFICYSVHYSFINNRQV